MSIGKVIRYIRPGENNPRNSEGAFYTFPNGRIIFIYSRYKGTSHSDGATADLYMLESTDGGESFVDVGTVFTCEELGGSNIYKTDLKCKLCLVIGGEDTGVNKLTKEKCDGVITISMYGKVNSLNASVALGVGVFEAVRQRKGN